LTPPLILAGFSAVFAALRAAHVAGHATGDDQPGTLSRAASDAW
jgi:hypothetical protein